jgi:glycosyltransferase involved in cell wall biosynthesis
MVKRLLFIVNVDWFFISHRLPIAIEAIKQGYEVHIVTTVTDKLDLLEESGIVVHDLNLNRSSIGFSVLTELWRFFSIIRNIKPDIVHLVTIKPVLLGGIASRLARVPAVVSAISGLGFIFNSQGPIAFIRYKLISLLYYLALGHKNQRVIFQNNDDKSKLCKIRDNVCDRSVLIRGSGVNLSLYSVVENNNSPLVVMMASRLLSSKGVKEFIQAAELVNKNNKKVRFVLVGDVDLSNPESINNSELDQWKLEGFVEIWGYRGDMYKVVPEADIVVLPSYYGEGLPKILIEAAACGRAVITTNHPGCRDAVEFDTGVLVPIKDHIALADAIQDLIQDSKKRQRMGKAGRRLAEKEFSVEKVVANHIQIYQELLSKV